MPGLVPLDACQSTRGEGKSDADDPSSEPPKERISPPGPNDPSSPSPPRALDFSAAAKSNELQTAGTWGGQAQEKML